MIIETPRFQGIAPTAGAPAGIMLLESNPAAANGAPPSYSSGLITSAPGVPTGATPVFPPLYIDSNTGVLHWYDGAAWIAAQFGIGYVDTVADLAAIGTLVDGSFWQTSGYHTDNDQGGNLYRYDATSVAVCDGGFILDGIGGENILAGANTTTYPGIGIGRFFAVSRTVADARKFGAVGDGSADASYRIQAAINTTVPVVLIPSGTYLIEETLTVPTFGQRLTSGAGKNADENIMQFGTRIIWGGVAGGTMISVSGGAVQVYGMLLDANFVANTCVNFQKARGQGIMYCVLDQFVGNALDLSGGTLPNHNGFSANDLLFLFAQGGTAINIVAAASENITFRNIVITRTTVGVLPGPKGLINIDSVHVCFYNMIIDDANNTGVYAIQATGGATFGIYDLTSECAQTLSRTSSGMIRPCIISRAELRSCNPQAGQYALDLRSSIATPAGENDVFILEGVKIKNLAGAPVIPQIRVEGATCCASGIVFEEQPVSPGKGGFSISGTAHVANFSTVSLNPNLRRFPLAFDSESPINGIPGGAVSRMLGWDATVLRVGANAGWTNATYDILSGKHIVRVANNTLLEMDSTIADGETTLLLRRNVGGVFTLQRVLMGAPDSGSVLGRRALEVLN